MLGIINELRDELRPLFKETIDKEDWNSIEWKHPHWVYQIFHDGYVYTYGLGYQEIKGSNPPRFIPHYPDSIGKPTNELPENGGYKVKAGYLSVTQTILLNNGNNYSAVFYPDSGKSIKEWAQAFIKDARAHIANSTA